MTMLAPNPNAVPTGPNTAPQPTPIVLGPNTAPQPTQVNVVDPLLTSFNQFEVDHNDLYKQTEAARNDYATANIEYQFGEKRRNWLAEKTLGKVFGERKQAGNKKVRARLDKSAERYIELRNRAVSQYLHDNVDINNHDEVAAKATELAIIESWTLETAIEKETKNIAENAEDKTQGRLANFYKWWVEPQAAIWTKEGRKLSSLKTRAGKGAIVAAPIAVGAALVAPAVGLTASAVVAFGVARSATRGLVKGMIDHQASMRFNDIGPDGLNEIHRSTEDRIQHIGDNAGQFALDAAQNGQNTGLTEMIIGHGALDVVNRGDQFAAERKSSRRKIYKQMGTYAVSGLLGLGIGSGLRTLVGTAYEMTAPVRASVMDTAGGTIEYLPGGSTIKSVFGGLQRDAIQASPTVSMDSVVQAQSGAAPLEMVDPAAPGVPPIDTAPHANPVVPQEGGGLFDKWFGRSNNGGAGSDAVVPKTPEQIAKELESIKNDPAKLAAFQNMFKDPQKFKLMDDTIQGRINGIPKMTNTQAGNVLKLAETQEAFKTMAHAPTDAMPNMVRTMEELRAANPNMSDADLAALGEKTLQFASIPGQNQAFEAMAKNPDAFKAMDAAYKAGAANAKSLADYNAQFDDKLKLAAVVQQMKEQGKSEEDIAKLFNDFKLAA